MNQVSIVLELEIDSSPMRSELLDGDGSWRGTGPVEGVTIALTGEEQGHGFGLSEVVTIVVSIGAGVASDVVADAVRSAMGKVIRRVKGRSRRSDGGREGMTELIESERPDPETSDGEQPNP